MHFVGCPVTIEREAVGPAQEVGPHGLTERLPVDSMDDWANYLDQLKAVST